MVLFTSLLLGAQQSITAARLHAGRQDALTARATAHDAVHGVAATLEAALQELFLRADVAFTGEVISIERTPSAVLIQWHVEDAIQGVAAGGTYTLREWPGLWQTNPNRYQKGQRALALLHAPSVAGYGSPVGGSDGVIAMRGEQQACTLDLRLLAQRVLVTDTARLRPAAMLKAAGGALALSDALQRDAAARAATQHAEQNAPGASMRYAWVPLQRAPDTGDDAGPVGEVPAQGIAPSALPLPDANASVDGAVVLSLLHAWQRTSGNTR